MLNLSCSASKRAENEAHNSKINIESNSQTISRRSFDHGIPKNLPNDAISNSNNGKNDESRKNSLNELTINPVNYSRIAAQDVITIFIFHINYFRLKN